MASFSVVELEPGCKGRGSLRVAGVALPVGPLGRQGPIQPFDFAVLPGAVGPDELLPDSVFGAHRAERVAVRPGVVRQELLDAGDAMGGEVPDRALEERRARRPLLVVEDLAVRQSGMIVDEGVDVVVADLGVAVALDRPAGAAVGPPAATVGDPAELLHVHVHQLARVLAFVTHRGLLRGTDHLTGDRVALTQIGHVVPTQNP